MLLRNNYRRIITLWKPAMAGFLGVIVLTVALLHPRPLIAQWERVHNFPEGITAIYFLGQFGEPNVGFVGTGVPFHLWRTSNGGLSWLLINTPYNPDGWYITDFDFKDSLNGWMASYINFRTTDGGLTWTPLLPANEVEDNQSIYYEAASGLLFSNSWDWFAWNSGGSSSLSSTDEGKTWQWFGANVNSNGYAFSGLNGVETLAADEVAPAFYTTNGGTTWLQSNFYYECWQPTCIPGTQTFFAASEIHDNISRSDDGGKTWRVIYQYCFPPPPFGLQDSTLSGCIRADHCGNLYAQTAKTGFIMSSDEGASWHSIGGPGAELDTRFWVTSDYLYASDDTLVNIDTPSTLWRYRLHNPGLVFSDGSKQTSLSPGSDVSVNFTPTGNEMAGADSVHLVIRYDGSSLVLKDLILSGNWKILDSSTNGNVLDIWLAADSVFQVQYPSLQINFQTYLASSSAKVYLDSANFYGGCGTCDCALSVNGLDSVEVDFTGCGDSLILAAMHGLPPFSIISIQPNPAQTSITVTLSGVGGIVGDASGSGIDVEMFDVLGQTILTQHSALSTQHLDVSKVPPGVYFLRLSQGGYAQSRQISIDR